MWHWGRVGPGFAVLLGVASCGLLVWVGVGQGLGAANSWAGVLGGVAGIVAAVAAVWPLIARTSQVIPLAGLEVSGWVVDRPAEVGQVVAALLAGGGGPVGITTRLEGAGGFGKTTLARMVCADRRVLRRYRGGVFLLTVGRDVRGRAAVAAKVNEVIKAVAGEDATFTDPDLAGGRLGALLDAGPRRLLVVDDVWEVGQLAPFTAGGRRCARLVTTRVPGLLAGEAVAVRVDQMSSEQAQRLLTDGLPPLDPLVVRGLLAVTGRWPLLLRLVNKILADASRTGADTAVVAVRLLERLLEGGPAVVDEMRGDGAKGLDVGQPDQRTQAVRATIEASASLLGPHDAERFAELSVFAEDEIIPFGLAARLWHATASLDELEAARVCGRLADLGLVIAHHADDGRSGMALHDVVRDFLRSEIGNQRLTELHGVLLDAAAAGLPTFDAPTRGMPVRTAWWGLGQADQYLLDHLIEHLLGADRNVEAEDLASDLRWVAARLQAFGPAAPAADLSLTDTPRTRRLAAVLARSGHMLAPTEPAHAVVDVLCSRVSDDPEWGPQVSALQDWRSGPRLVNHWPLPDLPDPAVRRVILVGDHQVNALAVAPDGSWLVTGSSDGMVRILDAATGQVRIAFAGHRRAVNAVAVAPDANWLATCGWDKKMRIWDPATGKERARISCDDTSAVAIAPDGNWLAIGIGLSIRIWDPATMTERARSDVRQTSWVTAVAVSPDGDWLATGSKDRGVLIWDAATGVKRLGLSHHDATESLTASGSTRTDSSSAWRTVRALVKAVRELVLVARGGNWVTTVAIAPDGAWLAAGGLDGTVRIWDVTSGRQRATFNGNAGPVMAMAVGPDGRWLATAFSDGLVRVWDVAAEKEQAVLSGHGGWVTALAVVPDGSWLAAASSDGTVSIWDVAAGRSRAEFAERAIWVDAMATLPDGSLVTGGLDCQIRIWDAATGKQRLVLSGHSAAVAGIAADPGGSWLASAGGDSEVQVWDLPTGSRRTALAGHGVWTAAVAAAPDGSWMATSGYDGVVRLRDIPSGTERAAFGTHRSRGRVPEVALGNWLVIQGYDRMKDIWGAVTGNGQTILQGSRAGTYTVVVSPDGTWLAITGLDPVVQSWDIPTGKRRPALTGHHSAVYTAAAAPDGSWLATGGQDGTVRIWDPALARQRAVLTGHRGTVYTVAVAPDARWLASGGSEGTVRIWDTTRWQTETLMRVDGQIFTCIWLGADRIACGGQAGLYVFDFLGGTGLLPAPPPDQPEPRDHPMTQV
ncbi:MAG TPA: NB-ARC domain-containing protein [Streptosporangiaceae bacterium]|nr:NB-ARC domain-containing protein [Streptosporangiaceae bacterium]